MEEIDQFTLIKILSDNQKEQIWNACFTGTELLVRLVVRNKKVYKFTISSGQIIESEKNKYIIKNKIGDGTFGIVYMIKNIVTGETFALKYFFYQDEGNYERQFLEKIKNCQYIVKMLDYFQIGDSMAILLPLMKFNLENRNFPVQTIFKITKNILLALKEIHALKIVHCDIKLSNILLDSDDEAYLCDFSSSCYAGAKSEEITTIWYRSPENCDIFNTDDKNNYSAEISCDMWSFGVCVLALLNRGYTPTIFKKFDPKELFVNISNRVKLWNVIEDIVSNYPKEYNFFGVLLKRLLEKDFRQRMTAQDALIFINQYNDVFDKKIDT